MNEGETAGVQAPGGGAGVDPMTGRHAPRRWTTAAVVAPAAAVLIAHAAWFLPFISDDALISLRYARRLLEGHGLTWTAGHPVEGYSNLLWLLAVASVGSLGVDLVVAARVLGVACMSVVLWAVARQYLDRLPLRVSWLPTSVALLFLALGAPMAVWAIGGLEQPLYALLLAFSIPAAFVILESDVPPLGRSLALSAALGLMCLTRPDGPLFAAAAALAIVMAGRGGVRPRIRQCLLVLSGPAIFVSGQLLFRFLYYGELVPNTALVKLAPSAVRGGDGLRYLAEGFWALAPWSLLALLASAALLLQRRTRRRAVYLVTTGAAWSAYLTVIGGDIFPAFRHFVPLMVLAAFALAEGSALLTERLIHRPRLIWLTAVLSALLFVPYAHGQFVHKQTRRAINERWEWQGKEVGLLLKAAFSTRQPLVAVTAAGCIPFWSELPALDMLGLNDYYLPRHLPPDFGTGFIGHELGDGRYVLDRKPDIIVFTVGSEPSFRSGLEMAAMEEFRERYVPVTVITDPGRHKALIYFAKHSPRIGIAETPDALRVPGFLLTGGRSTASLNESNRLVLRLPAGDAAELALADRAGSTWTVEVRTPEPAEVTGEVEREGGVLRVTVRSKASRTVDIEEVVLRRPAR